jgi:hypothetical protein
VNFFPLSENKNKKNNVLDQIKILKTKRAKRKENKKYKDQNELFAQTLKVPLFFHSFFTLVVHLSILFFFNKSEQINNQFGHKITKLRRKKILS